MEVSGTGGVSTGGDSQEQGEQHAEQKDDGHSGEGAASALAHLKTQRQHRHLTGEPEDAAGNSASGGHGQ